VFSGSVSAVKKCQNGWTALIAGERGGSAKTILIVRGISKADAIAVEPAHRVQLATHPISQIRQKCLKDIVRW
jgi:hypothetical protein